MKSFYFATATALVWMIFTISSCAVQEEKKITTPAAPTPAPPAPKAEAKAPPAEKAPAKAKVEKTKGDVGLLDLEKNYMILVTKEGKLVTLDFDQKTKVTKVMPTPSKIADVGLGSSATVTYTKENNKNVASNVEYKAAKGGD
ncbi:MAG TPA: hypothetical protein VFU31_14760 [Candidatus Binatia bacterium]|nr:hypothetical protein [Candidatus Binatia bacterium]